MTDSHYSDDYDYYDGYGHYHYYGYDYGYGNPDYGYGYDHVGAREDSYWRMYREEYEALGLERSACSADIKAAFRKRAVQWHPDKWQQQFAERLAAGAELLPRFAWRDGRERAAELVRPLVQPRGVRGRPAGGGAAPRPPRGARRRARARRARGRGARGVPCSRRSAARRPRAPSPRPRRRCSGIAGPTPSPAWPRRCPRAGSGPAS